jgi:hypothetical protein
MVEVRFASRQLFGRCGTKRERVAAFGAETARALAIRLAQLVAVDSLHELSVMPCVSATSDDGQLLIEVDGEMSLLLRPIQTQSNRLEGLEVAAVIFRGKKEK